MRLGVVPKALSQEGQQRLKQGFTSAARSPVKTYQSKMGMRFDQLKNRVKGVFTGERKRVPSIGQRPSGFGSKISRSTNDVGIQQQRQNKLRSSMNAAQPKPSTSRMTRTRSSALQSSPTPKMTVQPPSSNNKFLQGTRQTRTRSSATPKPTVQRALGQGMNTLKPRQPRY